CEKCANRVSPRHPRPPINEPYWLLHSVCEFASIEHSASISVATWIRTLAHASRCFPRRVSPGLLEPRVALHRATAPAHEQHQRRLTRRRQDEGSAPCHAGASTSQPSWAITCRMAPRDVAMASGSSIATVPRCAA